MPFKDEQKKKACAAAYRERLKTEPELIARRKAWVESNRANIRRSVAKSSKRRRRERRDFLNKLKSVPCADCHTKFPACCMDFDHRPGVEKRGEVCRMLLDNAPIEVILEEVSKCDVVCSNCHRIRSHNRLYPLNPAKIGYSDEG